MVRCNSPVIIILLLLKKSKPFATKQAPLKEWIPLAKDETNWKAHINAYFEACQTTKEDDENNSKTLTVRMTEMMMLRQYLI